MKDKHNENHEKVLIAGKVTPEVRKAIEQIAKDEDRTVSNVLSRLLASSPQVKKRIEQTTEQQAA